MTCIHPNGFVKERCKCGLYFQKCPICERSMVMCTTCQAELTTTNELRRKGIRRPPGWYGETVGQEERIPVEIEPHDPEERT